MLTLNALPVLSSQAQPDTITVTGTVEHGTFNQTVPDDLTVVLRYGSADSGYDELQTDLSTDRAFRFTDVPGDAEAYLVYAQYDGLFISSDTFTVDDLESPVTLTLYNRTEDPFVLRISSMSIAIQPHEIEGMDSGLIFTQQMTVTNQSDRIYLDTGSFQPVSVAISLPPGAILAEPDPRYLEGSEPFTLLDTNPVYPGENTLRVVYFLPYDDEAIIDQTLYYPFRGPLTITIMPEQLSIIHDDLTPDPDNPGSYSGTLDINTGSLIYEIGGSLTQPEAASSESGTTQSSIVIILVVGVVGIAIIAGLLLAATRGSERDRSINQIIQQLEELDAMHDAGQINHDVYRKQQQALHARLDALRSEQTAHDEKRTDEETS